MKNIFQQKNNINQFSNFFNINKYLIGVFVILFIGRVSISGMGYLEDSDEVDYYFAEAAYDSLVSFDFKSFSNNIAQTEGKPTESLIKLFIVPIHRLWTWIIDAPIYSVKSLVPLALYNILISLSILLVFYFIQLSLKISKPNATTGVLTLGVFINYNMYTRHILSYDLGLLFMMLALFVFLKKNKDDTIKFILIGLLCVFGFTTYHGYFMFVFLILLLIFLNRKTSNLSFYKQILFFSIPFFLVFTLYELLFQLGGNSFINETFKIGGTISQGTHSEGFIYAIIYMFEIEKVLGALVLIAYLMSVLYSLKLKSNLDKVLIVSLLTYLSYAFFVNILMQFVFYGRILHMYFPFFVLGFIYLFQKHLEKFGTKANVIVFLLLMAQYTYNIMDMNSIDYPKHIIEKFSLNNDGFKYVYELDNTDNYLNLIGKIHNENNYNNEDNLTIGNVCFFKHHPDRFINSYNNFDLKNKEIVFSKLHFMSHPFYTFEYCSNIGRSFYLDKKLKIFIVKDIN